jgi:S1-C subfamily serine protease
MRRFLLAGLFVVALFSMLCIGFALGAIFSPTLGRLGQTLFQGFTHSRIDRLEQPGSRIQIPQDNAEAIQPGVVILQVLTGSPAEQAGLKTGDIVVSANGQSLSQPDDLAGIISKLKPADTLKLEVQQENAKNEVSAKLGENPDKKGAAWLGIRYGPVAQVPALPGGKNDQLPALPHDFSFGEGMLHPGVLISEVVSGSPAEKSGLKTGQMIQAVDRKNLDGSKSLAEIIATYKPGDTITLTIFDPSTGGKQAQDVQVKLGESPDKAGAAWLGIRVTAIDIHPNLSPGG